MKRILIVLLITLFTVPVYAGNKCGVLDKYENEKHTHYPREEVGGTGHYMIDSWGYWLEHSDDPDRYDEGSWIEDKDGNDLYWLDGYFIVLSEEYEIYILMNPDDTQKGLLSGNMREFALNAWENPRYICIDFDDFAVIAVTDYDKNYNCDPTKTDVTRYFDTDGGEIEDIYSYIDSRGKGGGNGVYYNSYYGMDKQFLPLEGIVGRPDSPLYSYDIGARQSVGTKGHWFVSYGSKVSDTGCVIEAEDGTDLFCGGYEMGIRLLDSEEEVYYVSSYNVKGDEYSVHYLMNGDFKKFGKDCPPKVGCLKYGDLKIYTLVNDGSNFIFNWHYFLADGTEIEDIDSFLAERGLALWDGEIVPKAQADEAAKAKAKERAKREMLARMKPDVILPDGFPVYSGIGIIVCIAVLLGVAAVNIKRHLLVSTKKEDK